MFAAGALIKLAGLIPSLRTSMKPAPKTAAANVAVGLAFCAAYVTLGLWLSFWTTLAHAGLWALLGFQAMRQYG